ncbi:MAG: HNH endonuclease [Bacilli bacterium]|nr:HNH endonuclease [Bacilli bacterium]
MEWYKLTEKLVDCFVRYYNNQKEFRDKVNRAYMNFCEKAGKEPQKVNLEGGFPETIDPFSVFGILSLHRSLKKRKMLYDELCSEFSIANNDTECIDWDIPHLTVFSMFYNFDGETYKTQTSILWEFFVLASKYKSIKREPSKLKKFEDLFNDIINFKSNDVAKISIILFTINPKQFVSLDSNDISYLYYIKGIDLVAELEIPKVDSNFHFKKCKGFQGKHYIKILNYLKDKKINFIKNAKDSNGFDFKLFKMGYYEKPVISKESRKITTFSDDPKKPKRNHDKKTKTYQPFKRNPKIADYVKHESGYRCALSCNHALFESKKNPHNNYVEVHHIIPFWAQSFFESGLDNPANMVALCPSCHREIHNGTNRQQLINLLLTQDRMSRLKQALLCKNKSNEEVNLSYLMKLYK